MTQVGQMNELKGRDRGPSRTGEIVPPEGIVAQSARLEGYIFPEHRRRLIRNANQEEHGDD